MVQRTTGKVLAAAALWVLLSACSGQSAQRVTDTADVRDDALHSLMVDNLDVLMARLNVLVYDQHRTVDDIEQAQRRHSRQMELIASELQQSAAGIQAARSRLGLSDSAAEHFATLGGTLARYSAELQQAAGNEQIVELPAILEQIRGTCDTCHQLYRGF